MPKGVRKMQIVKDLKSRMKDGKVGVNLLADHAGISSRTLILARTGTAISAFLAECIETALTKITKR